MKNDKICFERNIVLLFLVGVISTEFVFFAGKFIPNQNTSTSSKAAITKKKPILPKTTKAKPKYYIGGSNTTIAKWPFVVMLTTYSKSLLPNGKYDLIGSRGCTGSILNKRWIVTAAHCVVSNSNTDLGIVVGMDNIDTQTVGVTANIQYIQPIKIKQHEQYAVVDVKGYGKMAQADIALVQVGTDLVQTGVEIATSIDYAATKAYGIGWGAYADSTGAITLARQLQELQVVQTPKGPEYAVVDFFSGTKFADKVLVTYLLPGQSVSWGDSGGPLVQWSSTKNVWQLVGVVSSGSQFTDATQYQKWISDSIKL